MEYPWRLDVNGSVQVNQGPVDGETVGEGRADAVGFGSVRDKASTVGDVTATTGTRGVDLETAKLATTRTTASVATRPSARRRLVARDRGPPPA